jgi:hypothetical protein
MSPPSSPFEVLAPWPASKEEQPQTGGKRQNEWWQKADVVQAGGRRGGEGPAERGWEVLHSVEEDSIIAFQSRSSAMVGGFH